MTQSSLVELSLELATLILHAAAEKAGSLGVRVNIAVVDTGPNLKGFFRMDGALLGAIDVAPKKALTSSKWRQAVSVNFLNREARFLTSSIPTEV